MNVDPELEELRRRRREEILRRLSPAPASAPSAVPVPLDAVGFDAFLASNRAAMVDFWATWCGPCRITAPLVEELAGEWAGRVAVGQVDVDAEPALAARYRVQSIPTFLFFRDGQLAGRLVGAQPKAAFDAAAAELAA